MAVQNARDTSIALSLCNHAVVGLLDKYVRTGSQHELELVARLQQAYVWVFQAVARLFTAPWVRKQITRALIECRTDSRFNLDAIDFLIRSAFIDVPTYDLHLAQSMENGLNFQVVNFAVRLVRLHFVENRGVLNETDMQHTLEILVRLVTAQAHNRSGGAAEG